MAAEIISRKDALAIGRVRYFTDKPCKHGHVAERYCCNKLCMECLLASRKAEQYNELRRRLRSENPEKYREADRRHRLTRSKDKRKEAARRWRAQNPEKCRAGYRKRYVKKSGMWCLYKNKRRALKLNAGGSFSVKQISDLFKKQKGKCASCVCSIKRGWENDHIIALACGGSNDISNIQLLCRPCNRKKSNKDPIIWAQENGRLL